MRAILTAILFSFTSAAAEAEKPNILFTLADDMGYGDVSVCNADSKIATPNIDRKTKPIAVHTLPKD